MLPAGSGGRANRPTIPLIYALTSWTHSPASSLQEYPVAQDIACKLALFLDAQPPSPHANELVAVVIRINALVATVFITSLLTPIKKIQISEKSTIEWMR